MLVMQPYEELERAWAATNGLNPEGMVACSSGTAALHLALESLGIPLGSKVVVPDFTMVACARAVVLAGHVPAFVDCLESNLLIDVQNIPEGEGIKAVMPVHVYGRRCDMDAIVNRCGGMWVIEDLAEAHGVRPHAETDAACWSFYRNKIVCGEEGGAVYFKNPDKAQLARKLRCLGFTERHDFYHIPRGHNYRMSNLHAKAVLDSLRGMGGAVQSRRIIESEYDSLIPDGWKMPYRDAPWVYDLRIPSMTSLKQTILVREMNSKGIAARHGFKPMSIQPEFQTLGYYSSNAYKASCEVIYLPLDYTLGKRKRTEAVAILKEMVF